MERFRKLDRFQKIVLWSLAAMIAIFCVIYAVVTSKVGFLYQDTILIPKEKNGVTTYTGRVLSRDCSITVAEDRSVSFFFDEEIYGPYTAKEDAAAVPKDHDLREKMTGIEVKEADEILFRGGVLQLGGEDGFLMMVNEDGTDFGSIVSVVMSDGTVWDWNGNPVDPLEPSVTTILSLMRGPELTHKGHWFFWFIGVFLSAVIAVSILYADELFRWNLSFRINNAEYAEPSDWEIAGRYIGWIVLTVVTLVIYITGLR